MPLPADIGRFTLTAEFPPLSPDGTERQGRLTFTPVPPVLVSDSGVYLGVENATLSASGTMTKILVANDALAEPFVWRVDVDITGLPPFVQNISVPASAGTVALGTLLETEALPGNYYVIVGPQGPQGVQGEAGSGEGGGTPSSTVTAATSYGQSSTAGVATAYSRGDHTHGTPALASSAATVSAVGDTATTGVGTSPARADHVHGREGFGAVTAQTSFGAASGNGSAATVARSDHTHGTPAAPTVGTTAGTYAAGNDSRITGAAQKAQNLGDLTDPAAARTSLSLGNAATRNVGTATGTVAAGDDSRMTDSRTPTGAASGDLSGTYPGPAVAAVNGVTVSGTASSGKVLTATSSSAATWQTPSGGGGAGIISVDGRIDQQIIVLTAAASWTIVATSGGIEIGTKVAASVGDHVWYSPSFMRTGGVVYLDMGIKAAGGGVSRYTSSGTATPESEGYAPMYPQTAFTGIVGMREFVVQEGEVDGDGNAMIVLAYKGPADGVNQKLYFGGGYSGAFFVANAGQ